MADVTRLWVGELNRGDARRIVAALERVFVRRFNRKPAGNITGATYNSGDNWPGLAKIHTDLGGMVWRAKRNPFAGISRRN